VIILSLIYLIYVLFLFFSRSNPPSVSKTTILNSQKTRPLFRYEVSDDSLENYYAPFLMGFSIPELGGKIEFFNFKKK
jgi:hypothetical protein